MSGNHCVKTINEKQLTSYSIIYVSNTRLTSLQHSRQSPYHIERSCTVEAEGHANIPNDGPDTCRSFERDQQAATSAWPCRHEQ